MEAVPVPRGWRVWLAWPRSGAAEPAMTELKAKVTDGRAVQTRGEIGPESLV